MDPSLYEAASSGDVGFLIGGHVSIHDVLNQKTPKHNNILHIAAEFKQTNFFDDLRLGDRLSPLFWAQNKKGNTPLHIAARVGCDEVVKFLVEEAKKTLPIGGGDQESGAVDDKKLLRMTNLETDTALHVAARYGHGGVVSLLMEADPELCGLTNSANESPLFLAIRQGFLLIAHSILNECPISPSFQGTNDVTALHAVVTHSDKVAQDIVKSMVSKYPETMKMVDALGWTPLHYAALRGNLEATQVLMKCDSSASYIPGLSGMSALHVAAYAGRTKVVKEIIRCRPDACDLLNDKGQTILHAAVLGERKNVVQYILKTPKLAGLINEADEDGNTPLHLAAIYQNCEIIRGLTRDKRVNTTAINKEFSKAVDIFLGDNSSKERQIKGDRMGLHHLERSVGVPFLQQQINHDFTKLEFPEKDRSIAPASGTDKKERSQAYLDQAFKIHDTKLLVATLIATVTFAAAFTIPGGFKTDGTAVLYKNTFFRIFLYCDLTSFVLSIYAIINGLMAVTTLERLLQIRLPSPASLPILLSIVGMFAAFVSGMVAVLPHNIDRVDVVDILGSIFVFTVIIIAAISMLKTVYQTTSMATKIRELRNRVI